MSPVYDDRALVIDETLVIADLHIGRGAGESISFPVGSGTEMIERFTELVKRYEPREVVVAGDLLHSFQTVPRTVTDIVASLRSACEDAGADLVVVPGNHDTMLDSVWDGPTVKSYRIGSTVICHGHELPPCDADRYVIGHDHPTIEIEGQRRPCYLRGGGQHTDCELLVVPSFNKLNAGVVINTMEASDFMSPLLTDAKRLRPIVWDEDTRKTREFPPLGEFRQML
jgi:putative SbcD/Mre11-related phosphoesterase